MAAKSLVVHGGTVGKPQLEMVVDDPVQAERAAARERSDQHLLFGELIAACRDAALAFGGYDKAANALDAIWGPLGRQVSASFLRATLDPKSSETRSYFRGEWLIWFAQQSAEVRDLMMGVASDAPKDPADELIDAEDVVREELGKVGDALIRKWKARRRRRR